MDNLLLFFDIEITLITFAGAAVSALMSMK